MVDNGSWQGHYVIILNFEREDIDNADGAGRFGDGPSTGGTQLE
jgi:hypothetical protein